MVRCGGVVMVTGGAGSIGAAIAIEAAQAGAAVAVCDINSLAAQGVADAIRVEGGEASAFTLDVRDRNSVSAVTTEAVQRFGPLTGLVTAAGLLRTGSISAQQEEDWRGVKSGNSNTRRVGGCLRSLAQRQLENSAAKPPRCLSQQ